MTSTVTTGPDRAPAPQPEQSEQQRDLVRHWTTPIALAVLTLISLAIFALTASGKEATFRISTDADAIRIPDLVAPTIPFGWTVTILMTVLTVLAVLQGRRRGTAAGWVPAVFAVLFVAGFLVWVVGAANTTSVFLTGLIAGSVTLAIPLIFGSMAGVLSERAGVVNIAIEGQLLAGAFTALLILT